jgi:hypothetical protein
VLTGVEDAFTLDAEVEVEALAGVGLDVEALVLVAGVEDDVPGIVWAPTMPRTATPATAVKAAPAVSRLSKTMAASRARIRPAVVGVLSMSVSLGPGPEANL